MRGNTSSQLIALVFLLALSAPSPATDPATIANQGAGGVVACASCHGKDGGGQASFPRLAGINAAYLLKQMQDFASGSRDSAVMKPIADALSPDERSAMAGYYAELPIPAPWIRPAEAPSPDTDPGARLALRGAWEKGVPACVQCHGPGGRGVGGVFPAIAAQPAAYLAAQLQAWKKGTRKNDPLELMRHLSRSLTEAEIKAVTAWFARQPAVAPEGGA